MSDEGHEQRSAPPHGRSAVSGEADEVRQKPRPVTELIPLRAAHTDSGGDVAPGFNSSPLHPRSIAPHCSIRRPRRAIFSRAVAPRAGARDGRTASQTANCAPPLPCESGGAGGSRPRRAICGGGHRGRTPRGRPSAARLAREGPGFARGVRRSPGACPRRSRDSAGAGGPCSAASGLVGGVAVARGV